MRKLTVIVALLALGGCMQLKVRDADGDMLRGLPVRAADGQVVYVNVRSVPYFDSKDLTIILDPEGRVQSLTTTSESSTGAIQQAADLVKTVIPIAAAARATR